MKRSSGSASSLSSSSSSSSDSSFGAPHSRPSAPSLPLSSSSAPEIPSSPSSALPPHIISSSSSLTLSPASSSSSLPKKSAALIPAVGSQGSPRGLACSSPYFRLPFSPKKSTPMALAARSFSSAAAFSAAKQEVETAASSFLVPLSSPPLCSPWLSSSPSLPPPPPRWRRSKPSASANGPKVYRLGPTRSITVVPAPMALVAAAPGGGGGAPTVAEQASGVSDLSAGSGGLAGHGPAMHSHAHAHISLLHYYDMMMIIVFIIIFIGELEKAELVSGLVCLSFLHDVNDKDVSLYEWMNGRKALWVELGCQYLLSD
mmetsp:Transcript_25393/g.41269  ORF Transcript_25393/g.41269 Transcript_25393/m.41269 type:complete len:316 (+) Transcript_25393:174-1121(+)